MAAQRSLVLSLLTYPLLFSLITPSNPRPTRFTQSREAISVAHTTFITCLSAYELYRSSSIWNIHPSPSPQVNSRPPGANSPLITTRSALGNAITAIETGYLVQDTFILLLGARLGARGNGGKGLVKDINWRVLGWHHAGLVSALGLLQWYIAKGKEKGILIIVLLMCMNASTPFGTLHWFLVNFRPEQKRRIFLANVAYLISYGAFRVGLVYWILKIFGAQRGISAREAFGGLMRPCQLGTAMIGGTNLIWWMFATRNFARRYFKGWLCLRKHRNDLLRK